MIVMKRVKKQTNGVSKINKKQTQGIKGRIKHKILLDPQQNRQLFLTDKCDVILRCISRLKADRDRFA